MLKKGFSFMNISIDFHISIRNVPTSKQMNQLCLRCWWLSRDSSLVHSASHLCFTAMFRLRWDSQVLENSDWSQGYPLSSCFLSLWRFRSFSIVAAYIHWSQGYLMPLCLLSLCCFRVLRQGVVYMHWSQGYVIPSCFAPMCCLSSDA